MKYKNLMLIVFSLYSLETISQVCPVPPTAIDFKIDSSYQFDKKNNEYIYTYRVSNGKVAKTEVFRFLIEAIEDATLVEAAPKWDKNFKPAEDGYPSVIRFMSSFNELKPGSPILQFKIKSKLSPGPTKYYVEGNGGELQAITVNGDNEVPPVCPGFFLDESTTYKQLVSGVTIGPVPSNQVQLKVLMKVLRTNSTQKINDEEDNPEISPADEGTIELIIPESKSVPLETIDLKSLTFGPYGTSPFQSEITTLGAKLSHWKLLSKLKLKLLYLKFKLSDLKIRCELDKALILNGTAGDKKIIGTVSIRPKLCTKLFMEKHSKKLSKK